MLSNEKILITGPASQVGFPIARELAKCNEVYGLARFSSGADRDRLEAAGVKCLKADMAEDSLDGVPGDFTYVLNFAVAKSGDDSFAHDLAVNAEGAGRLMYHTRRAKAWLHCSSAGVYRPAGHQPLKECDALGDSHQHLLPTYSICKIAAETVVQFCARQWSIPTTIARLSVPYGDNGGWPSMHLDWMLAGQPIVAHAHKPNLYNPIHEDDYIEHIPKLLAVASVPATVVNWGGSEPASIEEWCEYMGRLIGSEPQFLYTENTIPSLPVEISRMHQLIGGTKVHWRDGMRRMIRSRHPEIPLREGV